MLVFPERNICISLLFEGSGMLPVLGGGGIHEIPDVVYRDSVEYSTQNASVVSGGICQRHMGLSGAATCPVPASSGFYYHPGPKSVEISSGGTTSVVYR